MASEFAFASTPISRLFPLPQEGGGNAFTMNNNPLNRVILKKKKVDWKIKSKLNKNIIIGKKSCQYFSLGPLAHTIYQYFGLKVDNVISMTPFAETSVDIKEHSSGFRASVSAE